MAYVRSLMGDADVISSREICLANNEDFILLILAALKSAEKNAFIVWNSLIVPLIVMDIKYLR